jgi:hypothetical protein
MRAMKPARVVSILLCVAAGALTPGCFLDRSGLLDDSEMDAGGDVDAARVDGGEFDAFVPLDTGPCAPGRPELCNGFDDDCDPATRDGSGDPEVGAPCDDALDVDLCADGARQCVSGALACVGDGADDTDEQELCNGVDDDCNAETSDGSAEASFGDPCDDPSDVDLCPGGSVSCDGSGLVCIGDDGDQPLELERCNGIDDDCNPATADGSAEATLGDPCDDPADADLCAEGTVACTGSSLRCVGDDGDQPDEVELCNGVDDDCDPATAEGSADPRVGVACDGSDADMCADGVGSCAAGTFSCSDDATSGIETCNGVDDDCDGTVDDGAGCPCNFRVRGDHSYLVCSAYSERRTWTEARDWCATRGYALATIGDATENVWLDNELDGIDRNTEYWIGANDRTTEMSWRWVSDGSAATYTNWGSGEPNNDGSFGAEEDCAEIQPSNSGASGTAGSWNDAACGNDRRFVCEAGP